MSEKRLFRTLEAFDEDLKDNEGFRKVQEHMFAERIASKVREILLDGKTHAFALYVDEERDERCGLLIHRETISDEEIVRCRDCRKWHFFDIEDGVRYGRCDEWSRVDSYYSNSTLEDGFCFWGERKES